MQPLFLKKTKFNLILKALQIFIFVISSLSSLVNSSNSLSKVSFFFFSLSITQLINNLLSFSFCFLLIHVLVIQQSQSTVQTIKQSFPIRLESPLNPLLAAYQKAEEEAKAEKKDNISF